MSEQKEEACAPLPEGFKEVKFGKESYVIKLPIEYHENVKELVGRVKAETSAGGSGGGDHPFNLRELMHLQEVEVEMIIEDFGDDPMPDVWSVLTVAIFTRDAPLVKAIVDSYRVVLSNTLAALDSTRLPPVLKLGGEFGGIFPPRSLLEMLVEDLVAQSTEVNGSCCGIPTSCQTIQEVLSMVLQPLTQLVADIVDSFPVETPGDTLLETDADLLWLREALGTLKSTPGPLPVDYVLILGDLKASQVVRSTSTIQTLKSAFGCVPVLGYDDDDKDVVPWNAVGASSFTFAVQDTTKLESVLAVFGPTTFLVGSGGPVVRDANQVKDLASLLHAAQPPPQEGELVSPTTPLQPATLEDQTLCPRLSAEAALRTTLYQCAVASAATTRDGEPLAMLPPEVHLQWKNRPLLLASAAFLSAKLNKPERVQQLVSLCPSFIQGFLFQTAMPPELFVLRGHTVHPTECRTDTLFKCVPDAEDANRMPLPKIKSWIATLEDVFLKAATREKARLDAAKVDEYADDYFEITQALDALRSALQDLTLQAQWLEAAASGSGGPSELSTEQQFERAQKGFGKVASKHSDAVKLKFYALFKQATIGDVNTSRPYALDPAGRAKWDAWSRVTGLTREEAVTRYIAEYEGLSAKRGGNANEHGPPTAGGGTHPFEQRDDDDGLQEDVRPKNRRANGFMGRVMDELGLRGIVLVALFLFLILRRPVRLLTGR